MLSADAPRSQPQAASAGAVPAVPEAIAARAQRAATRFARMGSRPTLSALAGGRIHDSFVVGCEVDPGCQRLLLQRINTRVFQDPAAVLENVVRVTKHLRARLEAEGAPDRDRRVLSLVAGRDGAPYWRDETGDWWRAYRFIEGTLTRHRVATPADAFLAARAFAAFARALTDLPGGPLRETIPAFHDTPARLMALERAVEADALNRAGSARDAIDALLARAPSAGTLTGAQIRGELPVRPVHNDTKVSNLLFDRASREPLCVVDLDTVMPGLTAHDFGDLVRSAAATAGEDEPDPSCGGLQLPLLEGLACGYVSGWAGGLTPAEVDSLIAGPRVITLELAVRFLTDHLAGDRYFACQRPGQNLERCRSQLALLGALEAHEDALAEALLHAAAG